MPKIVNYWICKRAYTENIDPCNGNRITIYKVQPLAILNKYKVKWYKFKFTVQVKSQICM